MKIRGRIYLLFMLFAVALLGVGSLAASQDGPQVVGKLHPTLADTAVFTPQKQVSVIIQAEDLTELTAVVQANGGVITQDLHIIQALAVEIPAGRLLQIAARPDVRWISPNDQVASTGKPPKGGDSSTDFVNYYLDTLNVRSVWDMGYQGEGIGVAVIDSGISPVNDFDSRIVARIPFNSDLNVVDSYGHGTHVGGIVGGNGTNSNGAYTGVAPQANLFSLNVSNSDGMAYEADVVAAMQWVYDNKDAYNIRVVNLSINSTAVSSYHESPMDAAAEILWFNGVVVVASAGNSGTSAQIDTVSAAPANDPFIITVGSTNENGTSRKQDDTIPAFSATGWTLDYHWKPDIFAPGKDIVSVLAQNSKWKQDYPERVTPDGKYFKLSGTSMSAPMVSGAAALLLEAEPQLTPDQVKYRLTWAADVINGNPYLDVEKAITWQIYGNANTNLEASQLLWTGEEPVVWDSVAWNSVAWNSVAWNSVAWNSVAWNSVAWNSVSWDD